nr:ATP-dependent sacrificial sulfur transferase LarE [uncultured Pseudodesulfovibrio sp.]
MINGAKKRYDSLLNLLSETGGALVTYSGGVDSTLLLHAAKEVLGDMLLATTVVTPYIPKWEVAEARQLAATMKVKHMVLSLPFPNALRMNPPDHCYTCKKTLFGTLKEAATDHGLPCVLDGTNADDILNFRPGLKALRELGITSPLMEAGLTKQNIRDLSQHIGLPTWNKPSFACLLSRMPVNERVHEEDLNRVEQAEVFLMNRGFPAVRVRHHGDIARIEVPRDRVGDLATSDIKHIDAKFKRLGYRHVTVDLAGYTMGSQNRPAE